MTAAVREIEAKTLLSSSKQPDPWFGLKYTWTKLLSAARAAAHAGGVA